MAETTSDKKWGNGKYNSPEELERGFQSLVNEITKIKAEKEVATTRAQANERLIEEMKQIYQAQAAQQAPQRPIVNDGQLDEAALLGLIDGRIKQVEQKLEQVPQTITNTLQSLFGPVQAVNQAANEFFARDDLAEDFSMDAMNKFLARNPGIRKTYDALVGNPQTAAEAYEYAYGQWRTTRPASGSAVNQQTKRDAGNTPRSGGAPVDIPQEGQPDAKALGELAKFARRSGDDMAKVAYFKARLEGTPELEGLREIARERGWRE